MESESRGLGVNGGGIAWGMNASSFGAQRDPVPSNYGPQRTESPHSLSPNRSTYSAGPQGPGNNSNPNANVHGNMYDHYLSSLTPKQLQQQQQQQLQSAGRHGVNPIPNQFIESRMLIHWPHPSFRFMFLGEPLKSQLSELLHKYRVKGVGITTPFRDKGNPSACLSIEG